MYGLLWLGPVSFEKLAVGFCGCNHSVELLVVACELLCKKDPGPPCMSREREKS